MRVSRFQDSPRPGDAFLDHERLQPETCFVCGTRNPLGLHVDFAKGDGDASASFTPSVHHEGWPGVVHGGILVCLLDEAMAYALWYKGFHAVTARMEARFKQIVGAGDKLEILGEVLSDRRGIIDAAGKVRLSDGTIVAEANGRFMHADVHY